MIHYPSHIPQIPLEEEIILTKQENDVNPFLPKCREYGIEVGASGWFMFLKDKIHYTAENYKFFGEEAFEYNNSKLKH